MNRESLRFSQIQWRYIKHWSVLTALATVIMIIFNRKLPFLFGSIAALFALGLILRVLDLYPGKPEPLILDFSGAIIALLFAQLAKTVATSGLRFLLIFLTSAIIVPHFWYILVHAEKLEYYINVESNDEKDK